MSATGQDRAAETGKPVRQARFGPSDVIVERKNDGTFYLRSPHPLPEYPANLTQRLDYWAAEAPERILFAERDDGGAWRCISYAQALDCVRRLGQALLDADLSPERPLVILSGNDIEHALLGRLGPVQHAHDPPGVHDGHRRLFFISAGNVPLDDRRNYPDVNDTALVQDPGQASNAITVGAYTEHVQFPQATHLSGLILIWRMLDRFVSPGQRRRCIKHWRSGMEHSSRRGSRDSQ